MELLVDDLLVCIGEMIQRRLEFDMSCLLIQARIGTGLSSHGDEPSGDEKVDEAGEAVYRCCVLCRQY